MKSRYLFIASVAVEHSSVLVVDELVNNLILVGDGQRELAVLCSDVLEVILPIKSTLQFPEQT